ncbi:MAG: hypothetical protein QXH80_01345 [Candidatus Nanoarchaeia archaeon]
MRKGKFFYITLNLIAPGIGQFAVKSYFRGAIMLLGALFFTFYSCALIVMPLYHNIKIMLAGGQGKFAYLDIKRFAISISALLLIWLWSLLDILFRKNFPTSIENMPQ